MALIAVWRPFGRCFIDEYKLMSHRYITICRTLYKTDVGEAELSSGEATLPTTSPQEAPNSLRPMPGLDLVMLISRVPVLKDIDRDWPSLKSYKSVNLRARNLLPV